MTDVCSGEEDIIYKECCKNGKDIYNAIFEWIPRRRHTADKLVEVADEIKNTRIKLSKAKIGAASTSIAGGLAVIGAGVATIFTAGAALPLAISAGVGLGVSVAGGATVIGTKIADAVITSRAVKEAQIAINIDRDEADEIDAKMQKLSSLATLAVIEGLNSIDDKVTFFVMQNAAPIMQCSPELVHSGMFAELFKTETIAKDTAAAVVTRAAIQGGQLVCGIANTARNIAAGIGGAFGRFGVKAGLTTVVSYSGKCFYC